MRVKAQLALVISTALVLCVIIGCDVYAGQGALREQNNRITRLATMWRAISVTDRSRTTASEFPGDATRAAVTQIAERIRWQFEKTMLSIIYRKFRMCSSWRKTKRFYILFAPIV